MEIEGKPLYKTEPRRFAEVELPEVGKLTRGEVPDMGEFGPIKDLKGIWKADGTGWNMIALPFHGNPPSNAGIKFRVLMNQYNEELIFDFVDDEVKNRGLLRPGTSEADQTVAVIDYQQRIVQIDAEDFPNSGLAGNPELAIHHEPGLWLFEKNRRVMDDEVTEDDVTEVELDVARLASIPHGNSVLAIGKSAYHKGMPEIPPLSGLPSGRFEDVSTPDYDFRDTTPPNNPDPYLEPFKHYIENPYKGTLAGNAGFPGFSPADMNELLRFANELLLKDGVKIVRTTTLTVDTKCKSGGITNLPFSVREAEPVSMKSTFWIQELDEKDDDGNPIMRLQYSQVVMLEFFHPRQDEFPGRAVWPHISIATLQKVPAPYKLKGV